MNSETAKKLCAITSEFYRCQSESFSATRSSPWKGWTRCLDEMRGASVAGGECCSVFDVGCGNLRFESFLASACPEYAWTFYAVDNCESLVPSAAWAGRGAALKYQTFDVMDALLRGENLHEALRVPLCDVAVAFGFLHHVPLVEHRLAVLSALIDQVRPGGLVMVSLWQFMCDAHLAEKARSTHLRALDELGLDPEEFEEGDYLLGWQNAPGAYRFCHSFSDTEVDHLVAAVAGRASLVARFVADGKSDTLNTYLVLQVA